MFDFNVCDVWWIEWNVAAARNPCDKRAADDNNVAHDAAVGERNIHDLECRAGLRLAGQELSPMVRQLNGRYHLTRIR